MLTSSLPDVVKNPDKCSEDYLDAIKERKGIRCVEFFSGIGGMRYGVEKSLDRASSSVTDDSIVSGYSTKKEISPKKKSLISCHAYEISLYANKTYAHNFKDAYVPPSKSKSGGSKNISSTETFSVCTKLVEQLKAEDLDGLADLWTMSPPCQPFTTTRNAKQLDSDDERCKGFKAIIELLGNIEEKPRWILLENVKGFVGSAMLSLWHDCLRECGYTFEEYLLSPTQFGIPNHRTRYYMICERSDRFSSQVRQKDDTSLSPLPGVAVNNFVDYKMQTISTYLIEGEYDQKASQALMVQSHVFEKDWAKGLGIVSPMDTVTHCFTAAYGRQMHRATGSLLLLDPERVAPVAEIPLDRSNMHQYEGKLRRFGPSELLRIFGFPHNVTFPEDISLSHQFKLVGNSVNVTVVSYVVSYLLTDAISVLKESCNSA